ncbi:MAG TPA: DUF5668 domain-containing protein [Pedobacter sp.]|jgi:hypothetical protein
MKTEKIIWGLILVFLGGILLFENLDIINFNWHVIFRFWPVVLILIGANLVFSRDESQSSKIILIVLTMLTIGFITYKGITTESDNGFHWSHNNDDHDVDNEKRSGSDVFLEEYNDSIKNVVLNISGGATEFILKDSTDNLFQADVDKNFGNYSLLSKSNDSLRTLDFKMKGKTKWEFNKDDTNNAVLKLNNKPVWDVNLEMGAGTANFDFSSFKINKMSLRGGAASFEIKLPAPVNTTTISVETGVSDIEFSIPRSASCKINVKSGLSSNDFDGFTKQADGSYTSENYKEASKTIFINFQGGMSNFEVKRY